VNSDESENCKKLFKKNDREEKVRRGHRKIEQDRTEESREVDGTEQNKIIDETLTAMAVVQIFEHDM
jgi:hypothetical protein